MKHKDLELPGELLVDTRSSPEEADEIHKPARVRFVHVDDFIDRNFGGAEGQRYARFFFSLARFPAAQQSDFHRWTKQFELYCTFEGSRYRVTGCSRMGDVWLRKDLTKDQGYDHRVNVAECSEWGAKP